MKASKLYILMVVLFIFIPVNIHINAQKVSIETTNLSIIEKRLQIDFDVLKSKKSDRFEIWVDINNEAGDKIPARTFSGDVGENLLGGKDKRIIWDYNADGLALDEEVTVFVNARQSTLTGAVSTGKVFFQSVALPGWGISSIEKGKPYWLLGVIGYAALGSSIALRSSYKSNYEKYLDTNDPAEATDYYNKSQSQKNTSGILMYTAIGTWSIALIWTLAKASKNNKSVVWDHNNHKFMWYTTIDPKSKKPLLGFQYKF